MDEKRRGRQEPTTGFTLPYEKTKGPEAIEMYEKTGRIAQDWQRALIYDIMALNDDDLWTHAKFGYSVPRQNGKNEVIAIRELYGLQRGERILHTAHRTMTSRSAWERLLKLMDLAGIKEIKGENLSGYKSGKSRGQEWIRLDDENGGGRIDFRTRTTTGGLGETFDLLVIDEAQEYQDDQESALKYTIVSSDNPQTIYLGTPPTPYSSGTIFPKLRKTILCGEARNSGWAEWSVDTETDPHDVDAWYETNPSLGYKLTERAIEEELGGDTVDFNIQRLGLWIKYNQKSAISRLDWEACQVSSLPSLLGRLSVGIKFSKDTDMVALSIAVKTAEEKVFVECIACHSVKDGNGWIIDFLSSVGDGCNKVAIDGASGAATLADDMKSARLKPPVIPKVGEYIKANAQWQTGLYDQTIIHMNQPSLTEVVTNCEKRAVGSGGGFGYRSLKMGAEISLMDSAILAAWACTEFKERKTQKIFY